LGQARFRQLQQPSQEFLRLKPKKTKQQQVERQHLPQSQALKAQAREQQTKLTRVNLSLTPALGLQKPKPDETRLERAEHRHQHLSQQALKNLALERQTELMQGSQ
jgi:hypothetical protein